MTVYSNYHSFSYSNLLQISPNLTTTGCTGWVNDSISENGIATETEARRRHGRSWKSQMSTIYAMEILVEQSPDLGNLDV